MPLATNTYKGGDFLLETINIDCSRFKTCGIGIGHGGLRVEYISPLAETHGKIYAPVLKDERYTDKDSLLVAVKELVDS